MVGGGGGVIRQFSIHPWNTFVMLMVLWFPSRFNLSLLLVFLLVKIYSCILCSMFATCIWIWKTWDLLETWHYWLVHIFVVCSVITCCWNIGQARAVRVVGSMILCALTVSSPAYLQLLSIIIIIISWIGLLFDHFVTELKSSVCIFRFYGQSFWAVTERLLLWHSASAAAMLTWWRHCLL